MYGHESYGCTSAVKVEVSHALQRLVGGGRTWILVGTVWSLSQSVSITGVIGFRRVDGDLLEKLIFLQHAR